MWIKTVINGKLIENIDTWINSQDREGQNFQNLTLWLKEGDTINQQIYNGGNLDFVYYNCGIYPNFDI